VVELGMLVVGEFRDEAAQLLLGLGAGLDGAAAGDQQGAELPGRAGAGLGVAVASPASTARAAASASAGSDLPRRRRVTRLGRLTSNTGTSALVRNWASR